MGLNVTLEGIFEEVTNSSAATPNTGNASTAWFASGAEEVEDLRVPQWVVIVYMAILAAGGVANLVHFVALSRCRRNGVLPLVMQIALVDVAVVDVSLKEVLVLRRHTWSFAPELCPVFNGAETLLSALQIYLIVCLNFHVITLWNLFQKDASRTRRNPLTSCSNSLSRDDSNECLVTRNENRGLSIDYRKRKIDLSVVFPSIFVWFVCISLSIPHFTLSSTLTISENFTLCAVIDAYHGQILQYLLVAFKAIAPAALLLTSTLILVIVLFQGHNSERNLDNALAKRHQDLRRTVKFAIALSVVYMCTSLERQVFHSLHVITYAFNRNDIGMFKMPPLYNAYLDDGVSIVYLAMVHYSGGLLRALLCIGLLPKFRYLLKTKLSVCCRLKINQ